MRITVHSAENQQRFAIALTLTQKWLTTKTKVDVVRLFVKRFDAKHGSKTTDALKLAVRNGDAIAPNQPLGAALGSSTDLELRRVESEDALAQLRKLETMEEAAISKAYRALARGEGDGLVRDLARVNSKRSTPRSKLFWRKIAQGGPSRARSTAAARFCGAQRPRPCQPDAPAALRRIGAARLYNSGAVFVAAAARRR